MIDHDVSCHLDRAVIRDSKTARGPVTRKIHVRLLHDGVQPGPPLEEALSFGVQDVKGGVHPGTAIPGAKQRFDLMLELMTANTERPVFRGPFVHGPPAARFLYLSWKRQGEPATPWGWRIKIPLSSMGWAEVSEAERDGMGLTADVTGRRPHTSEPVDWRVERIIK